MLFPSVDHQSVYSDTGSVTPVIGVISSSGANYVFTQTDSIEISWNGQEVPIQEIIANYLTSYGSEVQWDVLITGNEICEIDDQLAVQNFFNPDISLARPGKDVDESLKSLTSDLSHKLYVYLNEDGGLEFQMSTSGDLYHPVDFTIVNASRLGLYDSYPTLSIDKSRNFNGPLPRTDATHFAGYTPSGSLISFPYGTIIGFYPGDGGEWPAGSVGGFQIGGEVYWGAWDNTPSRKTFLGYICQAGMGVADPCNPVLNPTFYLPTSNQASGEMVVHGTVVAARLGNPDTCSIYVYQSEWNDEALEILHVNVDRAESAVADQIVDFIPVPENAYEGVGTMSNPHCLDANGLCRVEAQYHPYLVGGDNNPIFRALQNNPCLVKNFEHVNFQIHLPPDEEMEVLKNVISMMLIAPLAGVMFEVVIIENAGSAMLQAGRYLAAEAVAFMETMEAGVLVQETLIAQTSKEAGRDFAIGVGMDLAIQSALYRYANPDSTWLDVAQHLNYYSGFTSGVDNLIVPYNKKLTSQLSAALVSGSLNCMFNGTISPNGDILEEFNTEACIRGFAVAVICRGLFSEGGKSVLQGLGKTGLYRLIIQLTRQLNTEFRHLLPDGTSWMDELYAIAKNGVGLDEGELQLLINSKNIDDRAFDRSYALINDWLKHGRYDEALQVVYSQEAAVFERFMKNHGLLTTFCEDFVSSNGLRDLFLGNLTTVRAWEVAFSDANLRRIPANLENISTHLGRNVHGADELRVAFEAASDKAKWLDDLNYGVVKTNTNKYEFANPAGQKITWPVQDPANYSNQVNAGLNSSDLGKVAEAEAMQRVMSVKPVEGFQIERRLGLNPAAELDIVTANEIIEVKKNIGKAKQSFVFTKSNGQPGQIANVKDQAIDTYVNPRGKRVLLYVKEPIPINPNTGSYFPSDQAYLDDLLNTHNIKVVNSLDELENIIQ